MNGRREIRVAESFFDELDSQLGSERGPNGEPSATDFIVMDLPRIVDEPGEHLLELGPVGGASRLACIQVLVDDLSARRGRPGV